MIQKELVSIRRGPSRFPGRSVAVIALAVAACGATLSSARADLLTAFNFNNGATMSGSVATPATLMSTAGQTTTITTTGFAAANVVVFAGTNLNEVAGDTAGSALGLQGGTIPTGSTSPANNGGSILFNVTGTNLMNLDVNYATQGTSTGFKNQALSYSLTGAAGPYTLFSTNTAIPTSFAVVDFNLSSASDINSANASTVYFELTFTGATAASGNNRIDNLMVTTVPEPTTVLGGLLLLVGAVWSQRRRSGGVLGCVA